MLPANLQRVLVTGAGGFIASSVIRDLADVGCSIIGIERDAMAPRQQANLAALDRSGIEIDVVEADMLDVDLAPVLREVDAVIHLAGSPGVESSWANGFDHHVSNNVVSTQRLLEAALDAPVQRIVVASSSSVYGSVTTGTADEHRALRPLSPYGASKAAMEMLVGAYIERGVSVVPLRYFTVYGPHQRPDMAMHKIIEAAGGGAPFTLRGDGHQQRSFTFVDDVARATVAALGVHSSIPINVGGATSTSLAQVIALVEQITGVGVPCTPVADLPGDPMRTSANARRARSLLGWEPRVELRAGLERQVEWQLAPSSVLR